MKHTSGTHYSLHYKAQDFKVYEQALDGGGNVVQSVEISNFAKMAPAVGEEIRRPLIEGLAREFADCLNEAYLGGWEDSITNTEQYWAEEKKNWIADNV